MAAQRGDHLVKMEAEMWMVYLQSHVRDRWHLGMRHEERFLSVAFRWSMALAKWEPWPFQPADLRN